MNVSVGDVVAIEQQCDDEKLLAEVLEVGDGELRVVFDGGQVEWVGLAICGVV